MAGRAWTNIRDLSASLNSQGILKFRYLYFLSVSIAIECRDNRREFLSLLLVEIIAALFSPIIIGFLILLCFIFLTLFSSNFQF